MSLLNLEQIHLESRFNAFKIRSKNRFFPKASNGTGLIKKKKKIGFEPAMHKKELFRGKPRFIQRASRGFMPNKKNCIIIYIQSTHNNTIFTLADSRGRTHYCVPTGMCGFKNSRKSTSYASQAAVEKLALLAKNSHALTFQQSSSSNKEQVFIKMKGLGPGKMSGVRAVHQHGFRVINVEDCTSLPHNGCRPPKLRRI